MNVWRRRAAIAGALAVGVGALAFVSAPDTATPAPSEVGSWSTPVTWPLHPSPPFPDSGRVVAVHMVLLETGQVLAWDAFSEGKNSETLYDPVTNGFSSVPSGLNLFCAAVTTTADGKALLFGGHVTPWIGTTDTTRFDGRTRNWSNLAKMSRARWYATATTLGDGRVLVLSGDQLSQDNTLPITPLSFRSDTVPEIYNPNSNGWVRVDSAASQMPLYPFMFVLPDGRVLEAGPGTRTRTFNVAQGTWTNADSSDIAGGSAVMYRPGKVLKSGAWAQPNWPDRDGEATGRAQVIDMTQASPQWQETGTMQFARFYHNLTVLPDGTVLVTGGGTDSEGTKANQATNTPELWDPATGQWTTLTPERDARLYHSTSILLPDARVLVAGGGRYGTATDFPTSEIYSPPYLFKGARPTITSAPPTQAYGAAFTTGTPDAAQIASAALIRLGSQTHGFGEDQRYVPLPILTRTANTLTLQAPSANDAPPGVYMLFLVNQNGVPSTAWTITFGTTSPDTQPPSVPGGLSASAAGSNVSLSWTTSVDNQGVRRYNVHRSTTSGFTPSPATLVTTTTATSYADSGLSSGTYYYRVVAEDWSGNTSAPSAQTSATVTAAPSGGGGGGAGGGGSGGGGSGSVDLELGLSGPATASAGDTITYSVTARNIGTAGATKTVARVTLPSGVELVSTQADRGPGCTGTTVVSCNLDFLSGAIVGHVQLTARVTSTGSLVASASIESAQQDGHPENNEASVTTSVAGTPTPSASPPVVRLKRVGSGPVKQGSIATARWVSVTASVSRPVRVQLTVTPADSTTSIRLLPGTRIGRTTASGRRLSVSGTVAAGTFGVKAVLDKWALMPGRWYVLKIVAKPSTGRSATLRISFKG